MPSVSAEALLISALINTRGRRGGGPYGISTSDFEGYADEYNWLVNYVETYGGPAHPGHLRPQVLLLPLPSPRRGPLGRGHGAPAANRRRMHEAMSEAMDLIHLGEVDAAYDLLCECQAPPGLAKPTAAAHRYRLPRRVGHQAVRGGAAVPTLQRHTGGIRAGNLWYVAGRPGQGKWAHLTSFAKHAVLTGNRVLFYSLEMSEEEVRARFHASLATEMGYPSITLSNLRDHARGPGGVPEVHRGADRAPGGGRRLPGRAHAGGRTGLTLGGRSAVRGVPADRHRLRGADDPGRRWPRRSMTGG